ncbi:venom carboxylesterase-6-like [Zerene cesonia]|uniref:venom carboxylesterase-6-like n=1 Tax=Zerene cesonia TaxID=33412 RepID=UPI0018E5A65C|nr:venom carboxylesterase-6-like [Zerene cesonia]
MLQLPSVKETNGFAITCGVLGQTSYPHVSIAQGTVVGTFSTYYEFYGIPYAGSTSGTNRYKAPSAPPIFETPFIADQKNIKCVRPLRFGYEGTEDCLALNVLTPTLNNTQGLPVMVWINGREFDKVVDPIFSYNNFLDKDVVVVTPNYRESIFGFLCLGTPDAPGNAGLKDIIGALQWIQQNIAAFGGDPDNVTVFGHGSGAALVDLVTVSQMSKGLIHKAISQSGSAMAPWAVSRDNLRHAINVAEALGHRITDLENLTDAFRRTSVSALMAVISELELTDNSLAFAPCLEREVSEDDKPFMTKSPYEIFNAGEQLDIPFITGFVDVEGTIRADEAVEEDWLDKMQESFTDFLQPDLGFETDVEEEEVAEKIRDHYFGNNSINMSTIDGYLSYHGDTLILVSAIREARMRVASSDTPVYLYQFSYKGSLGSIFQGPLNINEAAHNEELSYLFHEDIWNTTSVTDLTIIDILVERWTNFAKSGWPSSETSSVEWESVTVNKTYFLRILDDQEVNRNEGGSLDIVLENPHPTTLAFWQDVYDVYFKDAKARWSVLDKNDDGDDVNVVDNDNGSGDNDDGNGENSEGDDDDTNDSAGLLIGCTFGIVVLFSILNMMHTSLMLS